MTEPELDGCGLQLPSQHLDQTGKYVRSCEWELNGIELRDKATKVSKLVQLHSRPLGRLQKEES